MLLNLRFISGARWPPHTWDLRNPAPSASEVVGSARTGCTGDPRQSPGEQGADCSPPPAPRSPLGLQGLGLCLSTHPARRAAYEGKLTPADSNLLQSQGRPAGFTCLPASTKASNMERCDLSPQATKALLPGE